MPRVVYYADDRGEEPVAEFLEQLARDSQASALATYEHGLGLLTEFWPIIRRPAEILDRRARLYELRAGDFRVGFGVEDDVIVLLHGWRKKTQKADEREVSVARRRLEEWRAHFHGKHS